MTHTQFVAAVRSQTWFYLEPSVGAAANMSLAELQQFIGGTYQPSETQLKQLARRMHMTEQVK